MLETVLITRGLLGSGALEENRDRESYVSKSSIRKIFIEADTRLVFFLFTKLVRFSMRWWGVDVEAFVVVRGGKVERIVKRGGGHDTLAL